MWGLIRSFSTSDLSCHWCALYKTLCSHSFPSDIRNDESLLILFYLGDFCFCVCLRACVCAWVQSLDWDHRRIKHQFSVCVVSCSINTVDCAHWHSVQNPHLSVWLRLITVLFSLCHQLCLNSNPLCSSKSPTFVLNNLMVLLKFRILLIPSCAIHTLK